MEDQMDSKRFYDQQRGLQAMSKKEIACRQQQAAGMRQRGPLSSGEQEAMRNAWVQTIDVQAGFIREMPRPTWRDRLKAFINGICK